MEILKWLIGVAVAAFVAGFGVFKFLEGTIDDRVSVGLAPGGIIGDKYDPEITSLKSSLNQKTDEVNALSATVRDLKDELISYAKTADTLSTKDLEPFALKRETVPTSALDKYALVGNTVRTQELDNYATNTSLQQGLQSLNDDIELPSRAVVAFDSDACPPGDWEEYKPLYGKFVRGIDKTGSKIDPDGKRPPGSPQGDLLKSHNHEYTTYRFPPQAFGGAISLDDSLPHRKYRSGNTGGVETRPKNVALLFCIKK